MEIVTLNNGLYDINVREYPGDGKKGFMVGCHGFGSSSDKKHFDKIAEKLREVGVAFAVHALPGHYGSSVDGGFLNGEMTQLEIESVFKYMQGRWKGPGFVLGLSYGADMMYEFSGRCGEVKGLVMMNTAVERGKVTQRFLSMKIPEIREKGYTYIGKKNPIKITEKYLDYMLSHEVFGAERKNNPPALFIHGELDELAPLADVKRFTEEKGYPLIVLKGEGHVFSEKAEDESSLLIRDFIEGINNV